MTGCRDASGGTDTSPAAASSPKCCALCAELRESGGWLFDGGAVLKFVIDEVDG
jgi:hypothetical protein